MWFTLTPGDLDYVRTAPFRFENEAELDAPPDAVFDILADTATWPKWFPDFRRATWKTDPPPGVGSVRVAELATVSAREKFIAWEPGARFTFTMLEMTLPLVSTMVEDYALTATPKGTRFRWTACYTPRTWVRPLHPIVRMVFSRMFRQATDGLVKYVAANARR